MKLGTKETSVIIGLMSVLAYMIPPVIAAIFTEAEKAAKELRISPHNIYIGYGVQVICGLFVTIALVLYVLRAETIETKEFRERVRTSPPALLIAGLFYTVIHVMVLVPLSLLLGIVPAIITLIILGIIIYQVDDLRRVGLAVVFYFLTPLGYALLVNLVVPYEFDLYARTIWGNPWIPDIQSNVGIMYGLMMLYSILAVVIAGKLQELALRLTGNKKEGMMDKITDAQGSNPRERKEEKGKRS